MFGTVLNTVTVRTTVQASTITNFTQWLEIIGLERQLDSKKGRDFTLPNTGPKYLAHNHHTYGFFVFIFQPKTEAL